MRHNLTLIGMPGAGKSTVGVILAKELSFGFIDTDILIQTHRKKSLQRILDDSGHLELRRIEEEEILKLNIERQVIATGGSAVYSDKAMAHLRQISRIVFIDVNFAEISRRIRNFASRGIAKSPEQSFHDLFLERQALYHRHADLRVDGNRLGQEELAVHIADLYRQGA
jgi:shikimate kinase